MSRANSFIRLPVFGVTVIIAAILGVGSASAAAAGTEEITAEGEVELEDPSGDLGPMSTSGGGEPPLDIVALALRSDGQSLSVEATLADPPGTFATSVVDLWIDVDNDPATGIEPFMDRPGGFELVAEITVCMDYGKGTACSGSLGDEVVERWAAVELDRFEGDSATMRKTIIRAMQFPGRRSSERFPISDRVVAASVAYTDLGVEPGQTIRVLAEESGGSASEGQAAFPIVLLTLQ